VHVEESPPGFQQTGSTGFHPANRHPSSGRLGADRLVRGPVHNASRTASGFQQPRGSDIGGCAFPTGRPPSDRANGRRATCQCNTCQCTTRQCSTCRSIARRSTAHRSTLHRRFTSRRVTGQRSAAGADFDSGAKTRASGQSGDQNSAAGTRHQMCPGRRLLPRLNPTHVTSPSIEPANALAVFQALAEKLLGNIRSFPRCRSAESYGFSRGRVRSSSRESATRFVARITSQSPR
jgi:hypothetical protein